MPLERIQGLGFPLRAHRLPFQHRLPRRIDERHALLAADVRIVDRRIEPDRLAAIHEPAHGLQEGALVGIPDDVYRREPGDGMPTVERLLVEAQAQEEARVAAILNAVA